MTYCDRIAQLRDMFREGTAPYVLAQGIIDDMSKPMRTEADAFVYDPAAEPSMGRDDAFPAKVAEALAPQANGFDPAYRDNDERVAGVAEERKRLRNERDRARRAAKR